MAITMGSDMGVYARDLATAFTNKDLVMPVPIADPADTTPVQMHRWILQVKEKEDKTKPSIGFKAMVLLKVEGQCTEAIKSRTIHHRDYEAANTEKDGFAPRTIIVGISIGNEGRRNTAVIALNAKGQFIKIRQVDEVL